MRWYFFKISTTDLWGNPYTLLPLTPDIVLAATRALIMASSTPWTVASNKGGHLVIGENRDRGCPISVKGLFIGG